MLITWMMVDEGPQQESWTALVPDLALLSKDNPKAGDLTRLPNSACDEL